MMPAFVLIVALGVFPDDQVSLHSFSDRVGCSQAAAVIIQTFPAVSTVACYDSYKGIVVERHARSGFSKPPALP